jgi:hypothetical protein
MLHDDFADSTTQALSRMTHGGMGAGHNALKFLRRQAESVRDGLRTGGEPRLGFVKRRVDIRTLDADTPKRDEPLLGRSVPGARRSGSVGGDGVRLRAQRLLRRRVRHRRARRFTLGPVSVRT